MTIQEKLRSSIGKSYDEKDKIYEELDNEIPEEYRYYLYLYFYGDDFEMMAAAKRLDEV